MTGHIEQEQELGAVKYFVSVAIPSVIYCGFSKAMKKLGADYFSDIYHSMPWEYKANELNSNTGNEQPWAQDWSDKYYAFWKGEE